MLGVGAFVGEERILAKQGGRQELGALPQCSGTVVSKGDQKSWHLHPRGQKL